MHAPLKIFAGLLDRSVEQIAVLASDARDFDAARIGALADIWDNNTFPLVSAACAPPLVRAGQARAALLWMAALGTGRRRLMVDLNPTLDDELPPAATERSVRRDYRARVFAGSFPLTTPIIADLDTDYDLANASVRQLTVRPEEAGLRVDMTLAAPRRFVPSAGRVARDGSLQPWPPAPLHLTCTGVTDLQFDATDRHGLRFTADARGLAVVIGRCGTIRATAASVWPDDPRWYESAAGRAADTQTPHQPLGRQQPVPTSALTAQQQAAARALTDLMLQIRLVSCYPELTATIPLQQLCRVTADAGSAILAAGTKCGAAREQAFADLTQRWRPVPPHNPPTPIPAGPAILRYLRYDEPHEDYDVRHDGAAVLVAAVPANDTAAPWRIASEQLNQPMIFHVAATALDAAQVVHRDSGTLRMNDVLIVQKTG